MSDTSLIGVLRERASLQPEDIAYTLMDYDHEWDGVAITLTWSQLNRRVRNLAVEMRALGKIGDRAVILAPQGLEYVIGFLASLEAGIIAVPLSVPMVGQHDERVSAVIRDSAPSIILTTSAVAATVREYAATTDDGAGAATVIEVDTLDLDARRKSLSSREEKPETAYLQYTSGSTRTPAGVMVTNRNLTSNFEQMMCDFFPHFGKVPPSGAHVVSWLPFYHDMGLMLGIVAPILGGWSTVFTTPLAFLARPARWIQLMGSFGRVVTAGPNFAFELAAGRTSDEDLAGIDLSDVIAVWSGAERVHEATLKRFAQRFGKFGFSESVLRPSYGLAEATLYVATGEPGPPSVVGFDPVKLSAGIAERVTDGGTQLVGYGRPEEPVVRIVDPETRLEVPAGGVGEIWSYGENNCLGYWQKDEQTEHTFRARIENPSDGTPEGPWLRTGDLGFLSDGELFIIGRIKDLLIVRGVNHYPDDIEATIQEITGGRVAAIAVEEDRTEQLVAIIEVKKRGDTEEAVVENLLTIKRDVASAVSQTHGISAADLVLVPRGAIPITTSGKIRRQSCVEKYNNHEFSRLDDKVPTA